MADMISTASITDPGRIPMSQRYEELEFVADCIRKSEALNQTRVNIIQEVMENYLVSPHGYMNDAQPRIGSPQIATSRSLLTRSRRNRSNLKDPETHSGVETLSAQGMGLLLGAKEFISADPMGADDPEKARYLSRILQSIFGLPGVYRTMYQLFKTSFTIGTSVLELGWQTLSRPQVQRTPIFADGVVIGEDMIPKEVIYRNRPLIAQIHRLDCYPDPSGTRIQEDMQYFFKRFRMPAWKADALAKAGIFNREGVNRAVAMAGRGVEHDGDEGRRQIFPDQPIEGPEMYKMLTGFEGYALVPYKPSDGYRNRVITVLEGEWMRSHINPYEDGDFPYKELVVNPIEGRFDGLSPAEVVRYLQDDADNMLMVYNDSANATANNVLLVGATFGGDKSRLRRRGPGDVISCGDVEAVKPLPVDTNALTFAYTEYQRKKQSMREGMGSINPIQEFQSDRQTATAFSGLVRLASQKVEMMVQLIERDDMPWIGRALHSRMLQFLDPNSEIVLAGEPSRFTVADIQVDADIRFVGSRQQISKFQKVAQLDKALTVLGQNPMLAVIYPQLVRRMLDELEIPDSERIVQQAQQAAMMMQGMEQAASGSPPGGPQSMTEAGQVEQGGEMVA